MTRDEMFGTSPAATNWTTVNGRISSLRLEFSEPPRVPPPFECGPHDNSCRRHQLEQSRFGATWALDCCPIHANTYHTLAV